MATAEVMAEQANGQTEFSALLLEYRMRARWTRNALAHEVGVDPSYLTRIEGGDRGPPRAHIIYALARVLRLTTFERNRLLAAAGYCPPIGSWTGLLQAVTEVMADLHLEEPARAEFAGIVCSMARLYRAAAANGREGR